MPGASRAAASSTTGAIARHGPHHEAQQSTISGTSLATLRSKVAAVSANGLRGKSGSLQLPHDGPWPSLSRTTRLAVAQCGQTTLSVPTLETVSIRLWWGWIWRTSISQQATRRGGAVRHLPGTLEHRLRPSA